MVTIPLPSPAITDFDFAFSENGLTAYRLGKPLASQSFIQWIGEENYQKLVNFILRYIADLDLPRKRYSSAMAWSTSLPSAVTARTYPLSSSFPLLFPHSATFPTTSSRSERNEFEKYDLARGIRAKFVEALKAEFPNLGLTYSIGGQISFDVFPTGWDKTYCLTHLKGEGFTNVHFFGDKTYKGGNDYEIYSHPDVLGHAVNSPDDTIRTLRELF
ncbi:eukaryotic phosphomannomutase-domain-containing protein [Endogone sp. FLAS-F59071]|nr:eukaryotic phosphomannomutase-domain-containing protein [Endogone sp. FLAS-F59071]|eukprot:RUS20921.1 eukaryotic phosphomannomutase-domain-containing protein [Endogone sp. FLAS-F59071]